jgi:hypothetical protein
MKTIGLALALALAAAPLRAAQLEAPRGLGLGGAVILAHPEWTTRFDALDLPGDAAQRGMLAVALIADGVSPELLKAQPGAAPALIDHAAAAYIRAALPRSLERTRDGKLALAHARWETFTHALSPFLTPASASELRDAARPMLEEARRRQLLDNEGRLTRTAEELGRAALTGSIVMAGPSSEAGERRLSPSSPRATPSRPEPRLYVRDRKEYVKPNPVARGFRLAMFWGSLFGFFNFQPPAVFADMDETIAPSQEPASPRMIKAIADILRAGGKYGVLTGSSIEAAKRNVVLPLMKELWYDKDALSRLAVVTRSGGQTYRYDHERRDFVLKRVASLDAYLISRGVDDGPEKIRGVLREAAEKFDFEGRMRAELGKGLQGDFIVEDRAEGTDILTQFVLMPTGHKISKEDKKKYDQTGGRAKRELYAAFVNERLRAIGLPMIEARVAGKTSIDIGVDKSLGFSVLAQELHADPKRVMWAGDSHGRFGNDAPAARMAGLVLNVGPREPISGRSFQEPDGGPRATLAYYRAAGLYARLVAWVRDLL